MALRDLLGLGELEIGGGGFALAAASTRSLLRAASLPVASSVLARGV